MLCSCKWCLFSECKGTLTTCRRYLVPNYHLALMQVAGLDQACLSSKAAGGPLDPGASPVGNHGSWGPPRLHIPCACVQVGSSPIAAPHMQVNAPYAGAPCICAERHASVQHGAPPHLCYMGLPGCWLPWHFRMLCVMPWAFGCCCFGKNRGSTGQVGTQGLHVNPSQTACGIQAASWTALL